MRQRRGDGAELHLDAAFEQIERRLRGAAIGHVGELDLRELLEQRAGEMGERGRTRRGVVEHARPGLRERDQVLHRLRRHAGVEREHEGRAAQHRDRREILDRIIGDGGEARGHRMRAGIGEPQRMAVRLRARDLRGAEAATAADAVLDHELLAQALAELLRDQARHGVGAAPGRERHDEADRPFRPAHVGGLRLRRACRNEPRQRGRNQANGQAIHGLASSGRIHRPQSWQPACQFM
jgi:hypothetical protein